ncbi:site-specific integrase [Proteiniphilum sp.]|uniref:tyrosine-type recombinase/integrase n=1 Tax=Proteiniphilum sp. TaxID=1926877 RepID=UPI003332D5D1
MKAKADYFLDTYHPKQDGTCNVKIRVYFNRKYMYYSTDIDLKPGKGKKEDKDFVPSELEKILTAKRRTPDQKEIHKKLNRYYQKADNIIDKLDTAFSFEKFDEMYHEGRDVFNSVYYAFKKYIDDLKAEERTGTAINYDASIKSLEDFKKNLKFTDITPSFLKKYERWMLDNGKSITTVGMYLRALRAIYNKQDIDKKLYPFGYGKYEIPSGENIKKALTIEEIARIYNYEATGTEAMARDYWMFLYLCNGMNVKDFCSLKWENIDGDILTYQREKTKRTNKKPKKITVSLKPETWAIINKYGIRSVVPGSYIFPHYEKGITATRKQEVSQQLIKTINKYMKRIARNVGINKNVTTYFARHSFATILKRSGTDIAMISDLLGHSSLGVTENYLDSFESDQISKQTDVLLSFNKKAQ